MAKFTVTIRADDLVEAYSAESAALDAVRRLQRADRMIVVDVTPPGGKTVFIRVEGDAVKRIA